MHACHARSAGAYIHPLLNVIADRSKEKGLTNTDKNGRAASWLHANVKGDGRGRKWRRPPRYIQHAYSRSAGIDVLSRRMCGLGRDPGSCSTVSALVAMHLETTQYSLRNNEGAYSTNS